MYVSLYNCVCVVDVLPFVYCLHVSPHVLGCSASSWTPPLTIGESFSLPCQEVYNGFNPRASVTWTCNGDLSLIFGIWNCTFGESVTISELGFDEHIVSLDGLNETLPYLQSQVCATNDHPVV